MDISFIATLIVFFLNFPDDDRLVAPLSSEPKKADAQAAAASKAADAQAAAANQQTNTSGYFRDRNGRWHRPNGQFASKQEILNAGLSW